MRTDRAAQIGLFEGLEPADDWALVGGQLWFCPHVIACSSYTQCVLNLCGALTLTTYYTLDTVLVSVIRLGVALMHPVGLRICQFTSGAHIIRY